MFPILKPTIILKMDLLIQQTTGHLIGSRINALSTTVLKFIEGTHAHLQRKIVLS